MGVLYHESDLELVLAMITVVLSPALHEGGYGCADVELWDQMYVGSNVMSSFSTFCGCLIILVIAMVKVEMK